MSSGGFNFPHTQRGIFGIIAAAVGIGGSLLSANASRKAGRSQQAADRARQAAARVINATKRRRSVVASVQERNRVGTAVAAGGVGLERSSALFGIQGSIRTQSEVAIKESRQVSDLDETAAQFEATANSRRIRADTFGAIGAAGRSAAAFF